MKNKSLPIFLAFLAMGFGDVAAPLVSLSRESFSLSNFMANMLPLTGFIMFGLLSVPMGLLQDRKSKKFVLSMGLFIAFLGLLLPIFKGMYGPVVNFGTNSNHSFYIILSSILLLGAGASMLQVSGNPVMRDVSPEGAYSSNLSFGQTVKAIGTSLGFLIPTFLAKPLGLDWTLLFPIYAVLIFITFLWVILTPITEKKDANAHPANIVSCLKLLTNPYVLMMVMAIFLYVGAEVSMNANVPLLLKDAYNMDIKSQGLLVSWGLFFFPIFIGRLLGGIILRYIKPKLFLIISVLLSLSGLLLFYAHGITAVFTGIVLTGLGFANIFPLIFSITIDRLPNRTNELSGLMITAILGGAVIPPVFGFVADRFTVATGFLVPLACVAYLAIVSLSQFNRKKA